MMRRRLYFLLPDADSARRMLDEMLLARIEVGHIHFLGKRGELPRDLPEANFMQKTDFVHGAQVGFGIGGLAGIAFGLLAVTYAPEGAPLRMVTVLIAALLGAMFGAWTASMVASSVPNSRLQRFQDDIERGKILMMADVPMGRVQEISDRVARRHSDAEPGGFEPTIPAFP